MPRAITDANPTVAEMEARVARLATRQPTDDYADAAIPGCERTTWRVLGGCSAVLSRLETRGPASFRAPRRPRSPAPPVPRWGRS